MVIMFEVFETVMQSSREISCPSDSIQERCVALSLTAVHVKVSHAPAGTGLSCDAVMFRLCSSSVLQNIIIYSVCVCSINFSKDLPFTAMVIVASYLSPSGSTTRHMNSDPSRSSVGYKLSTNSFAPLLSLLYGISSEPSSSIHWIAAT